ncbi:MAG: DUF4331 family protein [Candidatus Baltobacteraceae bacterium]
MRRTFITGVSSICALLLGAAGCGGTTNSPVTVPGGGASTAGYVQVERLARPAIKEATENFANHDATNRVSPTNDTVLATSIHDFARFVGRDEAHATTLVKVLIPDEMSADLSKADAAGYLGIETGGAAGPIKSSFGGRGLTNDAVDTDLYAVFGTALSDLKLVAPDNAQLPCLTTDNVNAPGPGNNITATFPYVGTPR